ncbi:hypothetical protein PR048_018229 [Dryococelus australis]|uniref:DUF5641 domain-containing protein n=1 Tax=Dryococelus australis TaxID=614101 RepID=A0ABQ9HBQ1_9NEOP|nr:hypothetical protein PR048_018229 [Dryococelus australis]
MTKLDYIIKIFSKLTMLQRVTAYCFRFLCNYKLPCAMWKTGPLELEELEESLHVSIRLAQSQEYPSETHAVSNRQQISSKRKLKCLNLFLCKAQLQHIGGRFQKSKIPFNQKHQVTLYMRHHPTQLKSFHSKHSSILYCLYKLKSETSQRLLGQLPHTRVSSAKPQNSDQIIHCYLHSYGYTNNPIRSCELYVQSSTALKRFLSQRVYPKHPTTLIPGHFLICTGITNIHEPDLGNVKRGLFSRRQLVQQKLQQFYHRCSKEYLNCLQQRVKWTSYSAKIKAGELVVLKRDKCTTNMLANGSHRSSFWN